MKHKAINPETHDDFMKKKNIPLSSVVVYKELVFVSGQAPIDATTGTFIKGDIETQTRCVMDNIKLALEEVGSSLDNIIKTTVFAVNSGMYERFNKIYALYFKGAPPARTFVTVGSFPYDFDIEIECIAYIPSLA